MDGRQSSSPVVYVGGWNRDNRDWNGWYVVDKESLQILPSKGGVAGDVHKRKRKKTKVLGRHMYSWASVKGKPDKKREELCTALKLQYSYNGTSFIIGEDLYWFGAKLRYGERGTMDLVKHNLNDDSSSWKTVSSYPYEFTSSGFSVFPVGTKLYVLHGTDGGCDETHFVPQDLNLRVEIYDLNSGAWQILPCPCINSLPYNYCAPFVALVENKDGEPKEFMFYSLIDGSLLFLDLASGESCIDKNHSALALYQKSAPYKAPVGLEHCYGLENLVLTTQCSPAIFSNNRLYWFTSDFHLYGYDLELRGWVQSPCLENLFPTCTPFRPWDDYYDYTPRLPFLVDLYNGQFMVIIPEGPGQVTVAYLTVLSVSVDSRHPLSVYVDSCHPLSLDDPSFWPRHELTMLKNTPSGSMHGPTISLMET